MTVTEAVAKAKELFGIEPSAAYKGIETADDFVFAIQTAEVQPQERPHG